MRGMASDRSGHNAVNSITGVATKAMSFSAGMTVWWTGAAHTRHDMKSIGATGGLFAPITTEVATMAAKCTG